MKFSVDQQVLLKKLNIVSKGVSQKTTMEILKGIYLEASEEGVLKLTASDMDFSVESTLACNVEIPGTALLNAKKLLDIVRSLDSEEILFNLNDNEIIYIKTPTFEIEIPTLDKDEFPNIGDVEGISSSINFDKEVLKEMIKKTEFVTSLDESKGVMVGVNFEIEKDKINVAALDGFRMSLVTENIVSEKTQNIIIYGKIIKEIYKIITEIEDYDNVNLIIGENKAVFNIKETRIITRLMEGEFIDYKRIFPTEILTSVIVSKNELIKSLERADLATRDSKDNVVKLNIKENIMIITAKSEEGSAKAELLMEKEGDDIEIGFNSKYLKEMLKRIDEDNIRLNFTNNLSPCPIKEVEGDSFKFLLLPVRIIH